MTRNQQDLAWNCLPREFREEVKRMWSVEGDCAIKYKSELHRHRTGLLYELFGDNLTSDAEGEEMLMVSRKRVQEMFGEAQKAVPTCEHDRGFRNAKLTILRNLFGSVCLPDNVDSVEHLKLKANSDFTPIPEKTVVYKWDKTAPKPAEPKEKNFPFPTKTIDDIIKDSSRNERRLNLAATIMGYIIQSGFYSLAENCREKNIADMAKLSMQITDALISESEKGGCHENA